MSNFELPHHNSRFGDGNSVSMASFFASLWSAAQNEMAAPLWLGGMGEPTLGRGAS
jgi:hypothetical protein